MGQVLEFDYARSFARRPRNQFRGVYGSFAEAEAAIPRNERVGYDHEEMAGLYRHRMEKANESDYAVLFWLKDLVAQAPFVFDVGGHVGVSYHGWRDYLAYPRGTRWLVYDMPAIVKVGAELARERPSPGLEFTSTLGDGAGCTVFLAAGSLQYRDQALSSVLAEMGGPLPRHIILNKMPVYDGASFVTVQSTGRAYHAYRVYNREELIGDVTQLGYRLVDQWSNREQRCEVPFTRDKTIEAYTGMYFTRDAR
ncbi:MAG TPA: methyltransferase, TIGR04325 family [Kofleriaceae bacterium]|nr:methyltransferase, TIGR04325 family [Kofleriaceae bacterium]